MNVPNRQILEHKNRFHGLLNTKKSPIKALCMVAHCLYRTVFVGAVLARLVHLRQVHPLRGAVLAWLVSLLARLMSLLARLVHLRQVHPLKVHPLRLLLDVPAYC